jgi:hypothetical protein
VVGDGDLARAADLLARFEQAVGNDPAVRAAVAAIAAAGGAPSFEEAIRLQRDTGDTGIDRPWQWLAAVAQEARRRGDRHLVAHLALFVTMWVTSFAPHLTLADQMDMSLATPPPHLLGEILSVALSEVPNLGAGSVITDGRTGRVTATDLLSVCAMTAIELRTELMEPQALATARAVAGR